jgi:hypothetical protein
LNINPLVPKLMPTLALLFLLVLCCSALFLAASPEPV